MKNKTVTLIMLVTLILIATMIITYADVLTNVDLRTNGVSADNDLYADRVVFIDEDEGVTYADAETLLKTVGTSDPDIDANVTTLDFYIGDDNVYTVSTGSNVITVKDLASETETSWVIKLDKAPRMVNGKLCLPVREFVEKIYKQTIAYKYEAGTHVVTVTIKG